jgi:ParB family transcriptional regulator, chromosome partitioning protein
LMAGDLDMGHARALLALTAAEQVMAAQEIVAKKLSVRDAERLVARSLSEQDRGRGSAGGANAKPTKPGKTRDVARLEERLADLLTATVEIRLQRRTKRGEAGEIAIRFESLDELSSVLEKLGVGEA